MAFFSFLSRKSESARLPFRTDIHCHILPGVDDGSPDVETSVELVKRMRNWGLDRIIATPHITEATFPNTPDVLDPALHELEDALKNAGVDVEFSRASENRIDDFFRSELAAVRSPLSRTGISSWKIRSFRSRGSLTSSCLT